MQIVFVDVFYFVMGEEFLFFFEVIDGELLCKWLSGVVMEGVWVFMVQLKCFDVDDVDFYGSVLCIGNVICVMSLVFVEVCVLCDFFGVQYLNMVDVMKFGQNLRLIICVQMEFVVGCVFFLNECFY